ncbi:hypothetical protein [Zobellella maritima]|uniref:hypothetical protein n=1 Tax=Zobellella maritima TaxID=2059725 RepID=UPI000E30196D|nr:hypothetical protein [Zobellella maritima]
MQDLNDLYYYVKVVDHGGFAPAGRALGGLGGEDAADDWRTGLAGGEPGQCIARLETARRDLPRGFPSRRGLLSAVRAFLEVIADAMDDVDFSMGEQ